MVKRILCLLLALLLCASLAAMLASCDEGGTPSAHTTHTYGEWQVFRAASCDVGGIDIRYCSCGAYETKPVANADHTYDAAYLCTQCGEQHQHNYGTWQTVVASTCKTEGTRMRVCACGLEEKATLAVLETHSYGTNGKCTVCGKSLATANLRVDENGIRWAKDEWGVWREYDNLPELDYGGETVTLLYWTGGGTVKPEFVQAEEIDDARLSSIYKRNEAIQDRLGVELNMVSEPGDANSISSFVARVQRSRDAETHDFDLIACYSRTQGALLMNGLSQNLTAIEDSYIELDKPWWPKSLAADLTVKNNLYFVTGEMSTNAIDQMHCIYFNKNLVDSQYYQWAFEYFAANAHVKTPEGADTASNMLYEKVYAGKWTLDDLISLSSNTYNDTRSDGVTADDTFGMCSVSYCVAALYGASNLRMIEAADGDALLKVSDDWTSVKTVRLITKLHSLFSTTSYHTNGTTSGSYFQPFNNGKCYFALYYFRMAEDHLICNDRVESYGVLPCPKCDTNQKNYYTVIGNEFSIYSVSSDFDRRGDEQATLSMLSAVLECWASEAYRKTTPVIFELNMMLKRAPTQCEADMCEIIRASVTFDFGRILSTVLGGGIDESISMDGMMANAATTGTSWSTVTGDNLSDIQENLASFVDRLRMTLV